MGVTTREFSRISDKLVYYFCFPLLLFYKIGSASQEGIDWNFLAASIATLLLMFLLSTLAIPILHITAFKAGTFSQTTYRFNTYIGMAVILTNMGESGARLFGILISFTIPLINFFAVSLLTWFGEKRTSYPRQFQIALKAILSNPLIIGCFAGILFSRYQLEFPLFIDNTLQLISMITLPLALLSIGSSLTLSGLKTNLPLSLIAAGFKLMLMPLLGFLLLSMFKVEPLSFKVAMIFFSLPASTAIYVLSTQLNSDTNLASSSILVSTILSFFSLSLTLSLFP